MRKLIFTFVALMTWFVGQAQHSSVDNLNKYKGPQFAVGVKSVGNDDVQTKTGPAEKNARNKPWARENKPSGDVKKERIYGPKGKFLMNKPRKN